MKLEEYMGELCKCKDEDLKDCLGVYDNYEILLNADFCKVLHHIIGTDKFEFAEDGKNKYGKRLIFNNAPGTILLQAMDYVNEGSCTGTEEDEKRMMENYSMTLMLNPHLDVDLDEPGWKRTMASLICEIGKYLIENNIPACFPKSQGNKYLDDSSRLVWHEP